MDVNVILTSVTDIVVAFGLKIIGAIIFWFVGRWLIGLSISLITKAFRRGEIEETLLVYLRSSLSVLLNVILVVAILGFFGIETTTFAAFLAAAGIAIGAAWSGLLAHFAAGAFQNLHQQQESMTSILTTKMSPEQWQLPLLIPSNPNQNRKKVLWKQLVVRHYGRL